MTGIRRSLLLLGLTVAVMIGALGPAQASFSDRVPLAPMEVATGTVAAPTSVTATIACSSTGATLSASWPASTSARVKAYLLTVVYSDGVKQAAPMQTGTSWSTAMTVFNSTKYTMQVTVATHTDYGWSSTATSSIGWVGC
jgi:hypothetical protein